VIYRTSYSNDIVKGCIGALDTAEKSTVSRGKKHGPAQLRVYNLGNTAPMQVGKLVSILENSPILIVTAQPIQLNHTQTVVLQ